MLVAYKDGCVEELVSYNELCDIVAEQHNKEESGETNLFTFLEVLEHEGPLQPSDPSYKGSLYNVKLLWNDHSVTWEPLAMMIGQDPVTMDVYVKTNRQNDNDYWKVPIETEMAQLFEYKCLRDLGRHGVDPQGYQQIPYCLVAWGD